MHARSTRTTPGRRIGLAVALIFSLALASLVAAAPPTPKVYRIGYLSYWECPDDPFLRVPFRQGLRELGYVEGRNLVIECRGAPGHLERLPGLAAELVRLNPDILVTSSTVIALAAKQATRTIPIVMVYVADPVESGIVSNLARPGTNITGVSLFAPEISQKHLELLKEVTPSASRVAVCMDSTNPGQKMLIEKMAAAAHALGIQLQRVEVRVAADIDTALGALLRQRVEALVVFPLIITPPDFQRIAEFAVRRRLPTITLHTPYVEAGLLMRYGANIPEQFRRAATYVDKILKGAKPADLPVEQPTKYELVINLKTAKALGLTIPPSLLMRADQVIE
jgi:putative tryptophan/tyrosine transport system substrate-binding protein